MSIPARSRIEILWQAAALATIALAAGLCIRQAAALPVTQDEARTYLDYIDVPLVRGFMTAGGAQYGVYALIARWPVRLFGLSEFTLRLPSIAAGPAFLVAAFLIARRLFGRGWLTLGTVAALALNPFTLEYFSAGTGDGLGLALFAWGLWLVFRYVSEDYDPPARLLPYAGLLFGLSVAASLPLAYAVVGVAAAFGALMRKFELNRLWGPAIVPAFVLIGLPLAVGNGTVSYRGVNSLEALAGSLGAEWYNTGLRIPAAYALAALFLPAVACAVYASLRSAKSVVLAGMALAGTAASIIAVHALAGAPYPLGRAALGVLFLLVLACAGAAATFRQKSARFVSAVPIVAVAAFGILALMAGHNHPRSDEWAEDAANRRIAAALRDRAHGQRITIAATPAAAPGLRFYRRCWRLDWLPADIGKPGEGAHDYYILRDGDRALVSRLGLKVLLHDLGSRSLLAVRP